jgi:hypothetical protein
MTQVLDKPPSTQKYTGSKFYLLAVTDLRTHYWNGLSWNETKRDAKVFPSYDAAEREQPQATEKAPFGSTVIISPEV